MHKILCSTLILIILAYPWKTLGKQDHEQSLVSVSQANTAPDVFYKKVVVYLKGGSVLTGLLVGVKNDLFIIRAGRKNEKVPLNNITKVTIETERKSGQYLSYGIIFGTYLGNLIFNHAKNQPIAYMEKIESGWEIFLQNALFISLGGGLGYLFSMTMEREEKSFNFEGSDQKRQDEWKRFLKYMSHEHSQKRLHISIQGGYVFTNVSRKYSGILTVFFTELNFYLNNSLSLGLLADYVFVPSMNAPGVPELNISEQRLRLGNGSIGINLSMHF